ncbi:Transcription factor Iwr1 [Nakaseomyces glabratus]|nr:Transcription factor Iwr1 [Nakaseomyces glabratus]
MGKRPEFIRLKRRRDEGSVATLLLEENAKKKKARYVFKLSKTVVSTDQLNKDETTTPLLKVAEDHRHFVLEQPRKRHREGEVDADTDKHSDESKSRLENQEELPPEITEMVNKYLTLNKDSENSRKKRKPSRKHFRGAAAEVKSLPSQDYVYDVYHLEQVPEDEYNKYEGSKVGFIKIIDVYGDLLPDELTDSDEQFLSDEEDSNDENYYRNDYPEDEDDDRSILFGSEGEEMAELETEFLANHDVDEFERPEMTDSADVIQPREDYDPKIATYDDVFSKLQGSSNILRSINDANFIDLDRDFEEEEGSDGEFMYNEEQEDKDEFPRNEFFPTDKDDPVAIHRDRIFHRLQKMIEKD